MDDFIDLTFIVKARLMRNDHSPVKAGFQLVEKIEGRQIVKLKYPSKT